MQWQCHMYEGGESLAGFPKSIWPLILAYIHIVVSLDWGEDKQPQVQGLRRNITTLLELLFGEHTTLVTILVGLQSL